MIEATGFFFFLLLLLLLLFSTLICCLPPTELILDFLFFPFYPQNTGHPQAPHVRAQPKELSHVCEGIRKSGGGGVMLNSSNG